MQFYIWFYFIKFLYLKTNAIDLPKKKLKITDYLFVSLLYCRVPQIFPWRANLLQSLAPTLIKLTYLWFSNDLEDSD